MLRSLFGFALLASVMSCSSSDTAAGGAGTQTGKIYFNVPNGSDTVSTYDFGTRATTKLFDACQSPAVFGTDIFCLGPIDGQISFANVRFEIYRSDLTGAQRQSVLKTDTALVDFDGLAISPDGSKLAFFDDGASNYSDVSKYDPYKGTGVITRDGQKVTSLEGLFHPAWLPNGGLVLTGSGIAPSGTLLVGPADGIFVTDATLANPKRIDQGLTNPMQPAVSPDGKRIAVIVSHHIWVINIDGSGLQQITTGDKSESSPAWSPDGSSVGCAAQGIFEDGEYSALGVVPANVTTPTSMEFNANIWPRGIDGVRVNPSGDLRWLK